METLKPLKILNASAGSGKTFNLVKEYIELLLDDNSSPHKFASIVAMTFTNKAAYEMKIRIISALDLLSYPDKYEVKSSDYAIVIGNSLGVNPVEIHEKAKKVLKYILHRYEDFNVLTIDKFNLRLIRSFSRDLNLSTDFEIILNENEVIEKVIDKMMSELDISENNRVANLIFEYAKSNVEEGEKWDFRNNLINFSQVISNEKYNSIVEELLKSDFSKENLSNLKYELKKERESFILECQRVYKVYEAENIESSELPDGSKTFNPINRLNGIEDFPKELFTEAFLKKCFATEVPKGKRFPQHVKEELISLYHYWNQQYPKYLSLKLYIKNYYNMALLQVMGKQLNDVRKDEQLIRISEFNSLISQLVKNEEAPFIYERLGTRFNHFLLDEFQDTSHLQWLNMVPLVHESIANMNKNLIVGDPKQSIYRFKNGVAEQFVALPKIYNPEKDEKIEEKSRFFDQQGELNVLGDNWRSGKNIVSFNNVFFESFKKYLSESNQAFYNSIFQNPKAINQGYVEIESFPVQDKEEVIEKEYEFILTKIEECLDNGFSKGDICLLGEKNLDCNQWAIFLSEKGHEVVSADSLLVDSDLTVQLTILYLKRRQKPHSENEKRKFAEKFFNHTSLNKYLDYKSFLKEIKSKEGDKKFLLFDEDRFIDTYFGSKDNFFCKYENIYSLIQSFYQIMNLNELKNPYLHHLADMAHQFDLNNGPDLSSFLSFYDQKKHKSAVQLPESENAIKIMSIHKSKGLEFPVVILPKMDLSNALISNNKYLFKDDNYIYFSTVKKDSAIEVIKNFQIKESEQTTTDSTNKCYVAFTRPVERLYVLNQFKNNLGKLIHETILDIDYDQHFEKYDIKNEGGVVNLKLGEKEIKQIFHKENKQSNFTPNSLQETLWFPDIALKHQDKLSDNDLKSDAQKFGNQFHYIISSISELNELKSFITEGIKTGKIESKNATRLEEEIIALFEHKEYQKILNGVEEIINEQDIIINSSNSLRPDKIFFKSNRNHAIIIDFKSGLPDKKYMKQIKDYAATILSMGIERVDGYLYFSGTRKFEKIV